MDRFAKIPSDILHADTFLALRPGAALLLVYVLEAFGIASGYGVRPVESIPLVWRAGAFPFCRAVFWQYLNDLVEAGFIIRLPSKGPSGSRYAISDAWRNKPPVRRNRPKNRPSKTVQKTDDNSPESRPLPSKNQTIDSPESRPLPSEKWTPFFNEEDQDTEKTLRSEKAAPALKLVSDNSSLGGKYRRFREAYPWTMTQSQDNRTWKIFQRINPNDETFTAIMAALERWKQSRQWTEDGGQFITRPWNFLQGDPPAWKAGPKVLPAAKPTKQNPHSTMPTPAEGGF